MFKRPVSGANPTTTPASKNQHHNGYPKTPGSPDSGDDLNSDSNEAATESDSESNATSTILLTPINPAKKNLNCSFAAVQYALSSPDQGTPCEELDVKFDGMNFEDIKIEAAGIEAAQVDRVGFVKVGVNRLQNDDDESSDDLQSSSAQSVVTPGNSNISTPSTQEIFIPTPR